nr:DNA-directed RNA polymerase subunit D [Halovenus rubra]
MSEYEVQFVERSERNARFVVRSVTPAFANGIRRAMIADVPTLSIDTVRFIENSSVMFDEQIGLRLGLVPLKTPPNEFEIGDEVTLSLDVSGPETAYSGDLVPGDGSVTVADDNIPIIDLKDGQRLEIEADAVLDVGNEHAKHQGGVAVGYRHLQTVEVVGEKSEFDDGEPHILRGVLEEQEAEHAAETGDGTPENGDLVPTGEFENDLTNRYPGKEVTVKDVPDAFVFDVETDGSLTADELVELAANTLGSRANELKDAVAL